MTVFERRAGGDESMAPSPGVPSTSAARRGTGGRSGGASGDRRRKRLLLLVPTSTYRTEDFMEAAGRLSVELVVASERDNVMATQFPEHLLTLPFARPAEAARRIREWAVTRPLDAVVAVDDGAVIAAAAIAEALGLRTNPVAAVGATRNKLVMRELLARADVPSPAFASVALTDEPELAAARTSYPCVLKPLVLSASRGVIRADSPAEFVAAFRRVAAILRSPDVAELGEGTDRILVEEFVPGVEVALEGLLRSGELATLALFDKPDPLDGPFFEETIYVTPSRLPSHVLDGVAAITERAAAAIRLSSGPVHAELRVASSERQRAGYPGEQRATDREGGDVRVIEIAARSIGGLCARTLRFGAGIALEELILRDALDLPIDDLTREAAASGVMMLPIERSGVLEEVRGQDAARAVPGVTGLEITVPRGRPVVALPEGDRYLGFLFARADTPEAVDAALRAGYAALDVVLSS